MRKERQSKKSWEVSDLAYLGAFLGLGIAGFHVYFWHIGQGHLPGGNPFLHIMLDLLAGTLSVASLFASAAGFLNWRAHW
jgi:hypothetical protein